MNEQDMRTIKDIRPEELTPLGRWLEDNRQPERLAFWKKVMFGLLALMVVLNLFIGNHHPHFWGLDAAPGFWPAISFLMGVVMIFFVKKIVQPLIKRPEDYYGDV